MLLAGQCYILTLIQEVNMNRKWIIAVPLFAILAWAAGTEQDAKTVISSATKALGADNLKTVEFSGSGFDYAIGLDRIQNGSLSNASRFTFMLGVEPE